MGNGNRRRRLSTPSPRRVIVLAPHERIDPSVDDVPDQEPCRVRAEIDSRYTHRDWLDGSG